MNEEIEVQSKEPSDHSGIWIFIIFTLVLCCLGIICIGFIGASFYLINTDETVFQPQSEPTVTATAFPEWPVVFEDDFSTVSGKWWSGSYSDESYKEKRLAWDGVFTWEFFSHKGYSFWDTPDIAAYSDFVVSVDVKHTTSNPGDEIGLMFRHTGDNHYVFKIKDNQTFAVDLYYLGDWIDLIDTMFEPSIKPGDWNHLSVRAEGDRFDFFINDKLVLSLKDDRLPDGVVGLLVDTGPESYQTPTDGYEIHLGAQFDNFELRAPVKLNQDPSKPVQLPQIVPAAGKIVFTSNRDGNRNLYVINSDGSNLQKITADLTDEYAPKWSPDGKQIVFVSNRDGNAEIYLVDANGKNLIRLTNDPAEDTSPNWSPDGKQIVFVSTRNQKPELFFLNVHDPNQEVTQLTNNQLEEQSPSWSPKGDQIVFQGKSAKNGNHLYLINIDGTQEHIVSYGNKQPAWSPDGKLIAFVSELYFEHTSIDVFDLATESSASVVERFKNNLYPAWSPSGDQIIFTSTRDGQTDLYIINSEGNGMFRVTHNEAVEEYPDWIAP